jgi:biopolymer transport protein ExbD
MRAKSLSTEDVRLSITPLIDVTFLLLIFFMCSMRFKTLERKVQAWLPKDKGLIHSDVRPPPLPKITVDLLRKPGESLTRVRFLGSVIGSGDSAFAELKRRIAAIHQEDPDIPGRIDAQAEVPHGHVVRCIDSFATAGVGEVEFVGAKMPEAFR